MEVTPNAPPLEQVFYPYAFEQVGRAQARGTRFVHYTNADAAMNILKSKEIWMRNASCMNDYTEVTHGLECLSAAYHGNAGNRIKSELNKLFDGISGQIESLFDGWQSTLETDTYLTCLSEHVDSEDEYGRLSMWRAYSKSTGIALVEVVLVCWTVWRPC